MWSYILVFFAITITDIGWVFYLYAIESRKSLYASMWASFIYLFGAFVVSSYVQDKTLIFAAALGSFAGTFITVEYKKWRERNTKSKFQE